MARSRLQAPALGRRAAAVAALALLAACCPTAAAARVLAAAAKDKWQLLWRDEFSGRALDGSRWEAMQGDGTAYTLPPGWGNGELQVYTERRENVRVEKGALVIEARRDATGEHAGQVTSARLRTAGRFSVAPSPAWPVVRVEARIKLPKGAGLWPALWLLPEEWAYGRWPLSGEIDVMEAANDMRSVLGSAHSGGVGALHTLHGGRPAALAGSWHVFGLQW